MTTVGETYFKYDAQDCLVHCCNENQQVEHFELLQVVAQVDYFRLVLKKAKVEEHQISAKKMRTKRCKSFPLVASSLDILQQFSSSWFLSCQYSEILNNIFIKK